ncbi:MULTISPECIES: hypothetical protein [unclassified Moorena]|uniref:hypothetical protein n=1 Tax=unclassified Moorena TaxID=2683338 RepID=UPI0013CD0BA9|nr:MULTISPECIES: hypothetical protein [unclassified Moorena]NEO17923.1 hypothetical protein [Moorena sp. SIO4A5]NEQ56310.1 hypothetical protein [Moorena sp. SIO4A1]
MICYYITLITFIIKIALFLESTSPTPDSRFPFPSWEGLGVGSDSRFPTPYSLLPLLSSIFHRKSPWSDAD